MKKLTRREVLRGLVGVVGLPVLPVKISGLDLGAGRDKTAMMVFRSKITTDRFNRNCDIVPSTGKPCDWIWNYKLKAWTSANHERLFIHTQLVSNLGLRG